MRMSVRATAALLCWCCLALLAADTAVVAIDCGTADPHKVDRIPMVGEGSKVGNTFPLDWPAPDSRDGYFYLLNCSQCPDSSVNTTETFHQYNNVKSATEYPVSIRAGLANCSLSDPFIVVAQTKLANLQGALSISEVTQTSYKASWTASVDVGVAYEIECADQDLTLRANKTLAVCLGMRAGSNLTVRVRAIKDGFTENRFSNYLVGIVYTKLIAVVKSSVTYVPTVNSIGISWPQVAIQNAYCQVNCTSRTGAIVSVQSNGTSVLCENLQPGDVYTLTIAVKKSVEFEDAVTELGNQETKEAPSSGVRNLRVSNQSADSAVVEFDEPEMKNGVILAYGIQASYKNADGVKSCSLLVMNVSSESCQLANCLTTEIIKKLASECDNRFTSLQTAESRQIKVRIEQLKQQTNYSVQVTPISQTLIGQSTEISFKTTGTAPGSNQLIIIVVSSVASVLVVGLIVSLVIVFVHRANKWVMTF